MSSAQSESIKHDASGMLSAHIVAIRSKGVVVAHQLRINGGGPGNTRYYSSLKFGSADKAELAAMRDQRQLGLPKTTTRGGSPVGRVSRLSRTDQAGIRFVWTSTTDTPFLRVHATWTDKKGIDRHTSFSCEKNGLEGALTLAISRRTSAGAPSPDPKKTEQLLKLLRKTYRSGPANAD